MRQLILIISSGIMLFLGIPALLFAVSQLQTSPQLYDYGLNTFAGFVFLSLFLGLILTITGIAILYKSKLIKTLIQR